MTPYQQFHTRQGTPVALFGVEEQDDGTVLALGIHAPRPLRAGRVLLDPTGHPHTLTTAVPGGLSLLGGPPGHTLEAPITLAPRRRP